jgi:hypothetical protein
MGKIPIYLLNQHEDKHANYQNRMNQKVWLSATAWALSLLAFAFLTQTSSSPGYDLSIYNQVPILFWYLILASISLHIIIAVQISLNHIYTSEDQAVLVYCVFGLAINTIAVILLPFILGYYSVAGDFSSHISRSIGINTLFNIPNDVFYPALYGLIQVVHVFTGVELRELWFIGAAVSYLLQISLVWLVIKDLTRSNRYALWAGLLAAIPLAGAYLRTMTPALITVNILVPLVFYLYINSRRRRHIAFNILLMLVAMMLAFAHPLVALMCVIWMAVLEMFLWLFNRYPLRVRDYPPLQMNPVSNDPGINLVPSLIIAIAWIMWISTFSVWRRNIVSVVSWFSGESLTQFTRVAALVDRSNLSFLEAVSYALRQVNGLLIYTCLALVSLPLYYFLSRRINPHHERFKYFLSLYALLLISLIASIFAFVGPLVGLDYFRFARFIIPWAVLVMALVPMIVDLVSQAAKKFIIAIVTTILIMTAAGGVLALHPSPYVFEPNDQLSLQQLSCMRWINEYGDDLPVMGIWSVRRIAESALNTQPAEPVKYPRLPLPDHFGYDQGMYLAAILGEPAYLLITEKDRRSVLELWQSAGKYTTGDFQALQSDPSAVLLYTNPQCEIWGISSSVSAALQ